MVPPLLSVMRIEQWYKNFVIFVGLVFSLNLTNPQMLIQSSLAFVVFCLLSSAVYIINDIKDIESDRHHPKKKNRPIPSGKIPLNHAWALSLTLMFISLFLGFYLRNLFGFICVTYLLLNLLYTYWLKSYAIVDVMMISIGFVLRAIGGTVVIDVRTSPWLIICSFLLALFLAVIKRKNELLQTTRHKEHRESLAYYTQDVLDNFLTITVTSLLITYMIYTFESGHIYMMATIPFAFIGVFRYIQLAGSTESDSPTFIFKDRITQLNILLWILVSIAALYELIPIFLNPLIQS